MTDSSVGEDETYKYFLKKLRARFHRRINRDGEEIEMLNTELVPPNSEHKHMDGHYKVDDKYQQNMEFQSTPVYARRMLGILMYMIFALAELFTEFRTCIVATYPPTQGIRELKFGNIVFTPDFFFTKNLKAGEIIKTVKYKNENNIALTDDEAIDLLIAPDMTHDYEIRELLKITTTLLVKAKIPDKNFHKDLIDCQRKVLKRFLNTDERKEIENMINIKAKAKELGIEPNVTGFEEAMALEYLDGKRDGEVIGFNNGKLDLARELLDRGVDEEIITQCSGISIEDLKRKL